MMNVVKVVFFIGLVSLAGCAGIPAKQDTLLANYNKLIVRPINLEETTTDKISGDEISEYKALWPSLGDKFKAEFEKSIKKTGYFDQVFYSTDAVADSTTVVLETKIVSLDPGIRWVMPGSAFYLGTVKNSAGKTIGKYSAKRSVSRPITSSMAGAIETLVSELGEDAAEKIGEANL
jgi:hypothetical protein